jgi:DNA-binding ferritin-like protein
MKNTLLIKFISLQEQFRILHWQTKSYARHNAFGGIYSDLDDLIDEFMEVYMGKYGRVEFEGEGTIILKNTKDLELNTFIKENLEFLKSLNEELNPSNDSDLLNVRDEIMGKINKLRYLLSLK